MAASGQGEDSGDSFAILSSFVAQPKVAKCRLKARGRARLSLQQEESLPRCKNDECLNYVRYFEFGQDLFGAKPLKPF